MPDIGAGAAIGSAIIGAGATIFGASEEASATQAATDASIAAQWEMYKQSRKDYAPWREAGEWALGTPEGRKGLIGLIKRGPGPFVPEEQPGFRFGFENFIEKPYLSSQSARGQRLSGETIKGLTKYAGDYAETAYDNFLNRYYAKLSPYQSLAGLGQTSATQTGQAALQTGTNIGNMQYQNALAQGNIMTGMTAGLAGVGQNAMQNYLNYQVYKKMGVIP